MVSCKYTKNTLIFVHENRPPKPVNFYGTLAKAFQLFNVVVFVFLIVVGIFEVPGKMSAQPSPCMNPQQQQPSEQEKVCIHINLCANIRITFVFMCLCICVCACLSWTVGVSMDQRVGPSGHTRNSPAGTEQEAWDGLGTNVMEQFWDSMRSIAGDSEHISLHNSTHPHGPSIESCVQCTGFAAVRCLTSRDTHRLPTGTDPIVLVSVFIDHIEDATIRISTPDQSRCHWCLGEDRWTGGYHIFTDHRNSPTVSHHHGQRIWAEQDSGHIYYTEDIARRVGSLVHLPDIRAILPCCHYSRKSNPYCPLSMRSLTFTLSFLRAKWSFSCLRIRVVGCWNMSFAVICVSRTIHGKLGLLLGRETIVIRKLGFTGSST